MSITGLLFLRSPTARGITRQRRWEKSSVHVWGQGIEADKKGGEKERTGSRNSWEKRAVLHPFPFQWLDWGLPPLVEPAHDPAGVEGAQKPPLSPPVHSWFNSCGTQLLKYEINELCTAQAACWAYPSTGRSVRCISLAALLSHSHLYNTKYRRKLYWLKYKILKKEINKTPTKQKTTTTPHRLGQDAIKSYLGHTCIIFRNYWEMLDTGGEKDI